MSEFARRIAPMNPALGKRRPPSHWYSVLLCMRRACARIYYSPLATRPCRAVSVTCWYLTTVPAPLKNQRWPSQGNLYCFQLATWVTSIATSAKTLLPPSKNVCGSKR